MTTKNFSSLLSVNGQAVVLTNDPRLVANSVSKVQATVDFGFASGGEDTVASVTVSAAWVTASSVILCTPLGINTADHSPDDVAVEGLTAYASNLVVGVGFDIIVSAPNGTWGRYLINAVGI